MAHTRTIYHMRRHVDTLSEMLIEIGRKMDHDNEQTDKALAEIEKKIDALTKKAKGG